MTRERAIQIMSNYDLNFNEVNEKLFDYGEVAEAFEMAIKALEGADLDGYSSRLWKAAYERGKADAERTRWIPVSERLPEEASGCLVTVEDDGWYEEPQRVLYPEIVGYDDETWNDADGEPIPFEVIAWMPLPKPYTAESD